MTESHRVVSYPDKAVICLQGDAASTLFVLRSGKVGVYLDIEHAKPTAEQVFTSGVKVSVVEEEGALIGEGGLFHAHRAASLVSLQSNTAVEHLQLGPKGLQRTMLERPELALKICRSLARRLREMTGTARDLSLAVDSIERAVDRLAAEYAHLIRDAQLLAHSVAGLKERLDPLSADELLARGDVARDHRRDTSAFFLQTGAHRAGLTHLQPDDLLCEEGKIGRSLFYVKEGLLEVRVGGHPIGRIGPEEIVGEIAVLLKETPKRTATVVAVEPSRLLAVPADEFFQQAVARPEILIAIAHMLSRRLDVTNRTVCMRSRSTDSMLMAIAGGPSSCESAFSRLSGILAAIPETQELAKRANQGAVKSAREREALKTALAPHLAAPPAQGKE